MYRQDMWVSRTTSAQQQSSSPQMKAESEAVRMFSQDRCHTVRKVWVLCGYSVPGKGWKHRPYPTSIAFNSDQGSTFRGKSGKRKKQGERKRSGGSLNLSCPNFPFVCVSKCGSVPKLPTTNSTQMDRTVLLIRYLQFTLLQFHQTRCLTNLNRGQHVFAWVAIPHLAIYRP